MQSKFVVIAGPSGVGKTTLVDKLLDVFPSLHRIISYTTRPQRPYEINGREYYFVSKEELVEMMKEDDSLTKTANKVYGYTYARTEKDIEFIIENNLHGVIVLYIDIVPEWKERFGDNAVCIFLRPPSLESLEKHLRKRSDNQKIVQQRLQNAITEIKKAEEDYKPIFDFILTLKDGQDKASRQLINLLEPIL